MSSGFVSSGELEEEKKKRQEEWEKVRKADDPLDAPEDEVCNKSLYEQLKHNKDKKDLEISEERSLKNLVRGIDEDESQFLSFVCDIQRKDERAKKEEEVAVLKEMKESRRINESIGSIGMNIKITPSNDTNRDIKSKQATLIGSLIKRKNTNDYIDNEKKCKKEDNDEKKYDLNEDSSSLEPSTTKKESISVAQFKSLVEYGSDDDTDEEEDK